MNAILTPESFTVLFARGGLGQVSTGGSAGAMGVGKYRDMIPAKHSSILYHFPVSRNIANTHHAPCACSTLIMNYTPFCQRVARAKSVGRTPPGHRNVPRYATISQNRLKIHVLHNLHHGAMAMDITNTHHTRRSPLKVGAFC